MGQVFSQQLWRLYGLFRTEDTHVVKANLNMLLTHQQRVIILRTWSTLSADIPGNGIAVMLRLLDSHPEVKRAFTFRDLTDFTMIEDLAFRRHSFVFVQAVMAVVENLDTLPTTMIPLLTDLGRKHSYYASLDPKFFYHLPDALVYVWEDQLKQRFTPLTEKAWRNIFNFIVSQMEEGFYMQLIAKDNSSRRGSMQADSSRGLDSEMSSRRTSMDLVGLSGNKQKTDMTSSAIDTTEIRPENSSSKLEQPSTDKSLESQTNFLSVIGSSILSRFSKSKLPPGRRSSSFSYSHEQAVGSVFPNNVNIRVEKPSEEVMKKRRSTISALKPPLL